MRKLLYVLLLLVFFTNTGISRENDDSTHVLFIGNSYTYYHSMPQIFRAMAENRFPGHQVEVKFIGRGGATLKQQWEDGRALEEILSGKWDYVVLQEQSMLGDEIIENGKSYVRSPDPFFEYAGKFAHEIEKSGAETVFFMTWSRKEYPQQQKYLSYAYMVIAMKTGNKIAPAGLVWDQLRREPSFDLYEKDGSHPSVYGSYLVSLILFSVIFDTDPIGISGHLKGHEILSGGRVSDKKTILCNLSEIEANIIQNAVSEIILNLKKGNGYIAVEKAVSDKKPSKFSALLTYFSDSKNQFIVLMVAVGIVLLAKGVVISFKND